MRLMGFNDPLCCKQAVGPNQAACQAACLLLVCFGGWLPLPQAVAADEPPPVTLDNVTDPGPNTPDEPLGEFSLNRAVRFLDSAAVHWQKQRKCFACHTNYAYLYARPAVAAAAPAHRAVRQFAEELVGVRWPEKGPRWDAEVVATAAALAFNDRQTTGKLHPLTRQALDKMWTLQRADGGWDWLKCDWPPMESDDDYGVALAALAVAVAPERYAQSAAAQQGLAKLLDYRRKNPPPTVHHQAMWLWAASHLESVMPGDQREAIAARLLKLQRPNGGWSLADLGDWKRHDGGPQSPTSDGYGTGFVLTVLSEHGIPRDHPQVRRGVAWLKSNQRQSGRWFTRSLHRDSRHYISHAGVAFAVMALAKYDD